MLRGPPSSVIQRVRVRLECLGNCQDPFVKRHGLVLLDRKGKVLRQKFLSTHPAITHHQAPRGHGFCGRQAKAFPTRHRDEDKGITHDRPQLLVGHILHRPDLPVRQFRRRPKQLRKQLALQLTLPRKIDDLLLLDFMERKVARIDEQWHMPVRQVREHVGGLLRGPRGAEEPPQGLRRIKPFCKGTEHARQHAGVILVQDDVRNAGKPGVLVAIREFRDQHQILGSGHRQPIDFRLPGQLPFQPGPMKRYHPKHSASGRFERRKGRLDTAVVIVVTIFGALEVHRNGIPVVPQDLRELKGDVDPPDRRAGFRKDKVDMPGT